MSELLDNKTYTLDLLTRLRDSLDNDHSCATIYEDEGHDPFNGRNGGKANSGKDWEGNECGECSLLLEVDKVIAESGGDGLLKKKKGRK